MNEIKKNITCDRETVALFQFGLFFEDLNMILNHDIYANKRFKSIDKTSPRVDLFIV